MKEPTVQPRAHAQGSADLHRLVEVSVNLTREYGMRNRIQRLAHDLLQYCTGYPDHVHTLLEGRLIQYVRRIHIIDSPYRWIEYINAVVVNLQLGLLVGANLEVIRSDFIPSWLVGWLVGKVTAPQIVACRRPLCLEELQ